MGFAKGTLSEASREKMRNSAIRVWKNKSYRRKMSLKRLENLKGRKFGKVEVLRLSERLGKHTYWLCKCFCGETKRFRSDTLKSKKNINCGCSRICPPLSEERKKYLSKIVKKFFKDKSKRKYLSRVSKALWETKSYRRKQSRTRKTEAWKEQASKSKIGSKNPMFGKTPNYCKFGNCKTEWINTRKGGRIFCRSSWEKSFALKLDKDRKIKKFEYEPFGIYYKFKTKEANYFPDFLVHFTNGKKLLVEIKAKGIFKFNKPLNRKKVRIAKTYCKDNNMTFMIMKRNPEKVYSSRISKFY